MTNATPHKQTTEIIANHSSNTNKGDLYSSMKDVNPMEVNGSDKDLTSEHNDVILDLGDSKMPEDILPKKDNEITHLSLSRYGTREEDTIKAVGDQVEFVKRESQNAEREAEAQIQETLEKLPTREEVTAQVDTVVEISEADEELPPCEIEVSVEVEAQVEAEVVSEVEAKVEAEVVPEVEAKVEAEIVPEVEAQVEAQLEFEVIPTPTKEVKPELEVVVEKTPVTKQYPKLSVDAQDSPMKVQTPPRVTSPGTANKNKKSLELNASGVDTFGANKSQSDFDPNAMETQKNSNYPMNLEEAVPLNTISEPETPQLEAQPIAQPETNTNPGSLALPGINIVNDDFRTAKESHSEQGSGKQQPDGFTVNLKTNNDFMTAIDINSAVMADDIMAEKDMENISEEGTVQTRSETLNMSNFKESIGTAQGDDPELAHRSTFTAGGDLLVDENLVKASMKKGGMKKRSKKNKP